MSQTSAKYCLHCGLARGRAGGCQECGPGAPGIEVRSHPGWLQPGTVLRDTYLIGRTLGHGGFGITYLGVDLNLDTREAVKEYLPRDLPTRNPNGQTVEAFPDSKRLFTHGRNRFLEEARVLARFGEHPNIVSVLTFFGANESAYLVMRYLEGGDLSHYMASAGGRLSPDQAVAITKEVLKGLHAVHGAGLLHRDIKPQNIYLTKEGGVKLLDFGSARYALVESSKTLTTILTPGYAAPEMYDPSDTVGPFTDVYSVGATLHQLLTGQGPKDLFSRVGDDSMHPPATINPSIHGALSDIVHRAVAMEPGERFPDVSSFLKALDELPESALGDGKRRRRPSTTKPQWAVTEQDPPPSPSGNPPTGDTGTGAATGAGTAAAAGASAGATVPTVTPASPAPLGVEMAAGAATPPPASPTATSQDMALDPTIRPPQQAQGITGPGGATPSALYGPTQSPGPGPTEPKQPTRAAPQARVTQPASPQAPSQAPAPQAPATSPSPSTQAPPAPQTESGTEKISPSRSAKHSPGLIVLWVLAAVGALALSATASVLTYRHFFQDDDGAKKTNTEKEGHTKRSTTAGEAGEAGEGSGKEPPPLNQAPNAPRKAPKPLYKVGGVKVPHEIAAVPACRAFLNYYNCYLTKSYAKKGEAALAIVPLTIQVMIKGLKMVTKSGGGETALHTACVIQIKIFKKQAPDTPDFNKCLDHLDMSQDADASM